MIDLQHLQFGYAPNRLVLNIPRFSVARSEKVFLFGPSGSGKSTLLEILAGVQTASAGLLKIDECDLRKLSAAEKDQFRAQNIGYIFQSFNLVPYLNVAENILLPTVFSSSGRGDQRALLARVESLCHQLGIAEFKTRKATELSVGQQQRVAAARAVLLQPKLILADEPTSALDFDHREKFLKVIFQLCEQSHSTLLFVSHDRSIAPLFDRQVNLLEINQAVSSASGQRGDQR